LRIVLDTNVLASALSSPNGAPAAVLQPILPGWVVPCFDARIPSEYREVLRRAKFDFDARLVDDLLDFLESEGELVASVGARSTTWKPASSAPRRRAQR